MKISEGDTTNIQAGPTAERRDWTSPSLTKVGTLSEVLAGGGGKTSLLGGDPGDGLKQPSPGG
jgi:hypothetical protein